MSDAIYPDERLEVAINAIEAYMRRELTAEEALVRCMRPVFAVWASRVRRRPSPPLRPRPRRRRSRGSGYCDETFAAASCRRSKGVNEMTNATKRLTEAEDRAQIETMIAEAESYLRDIDNQAAALWKALNGAKAVLDDPRLAYEVWETESQAIAACGDVHDDLQITNVLVRVCFRGRDILAAEAEAAE